MAGRKLDPVLRPSTGLRASTLRRSRDEWPTGLGREQELRAAGSLAKACGELRSPPPRPPSDAYENRLLPAAAGDSARIAFSAARQREDEPVIEWHARLRSLFERAYPNKTNAQINTDIDLKQRFILGLADEEARKRVWYHRPIDYEHALEDANNAVQGGHILNMASGVKSESKGAGLHAVGSSEAGEREAEAARSQPPTAAAMRAGCWECGSVDHFRRECPRLAAGRGPARGGRGRGGRGFPEA